MDRDEGGVILAHAAGVAESALCFARRKLLTYITDRFFFVVQAVVLLSRSAIQFSCHSAISSSSQPTCRGPSGIGAGNSPLATASASAVFFLPVNFRTSGWR